MTLPPVDSCRGSAIGAGPNPLPAGTHVVKRRSRLTLVSYHANSLAHRGAAATRTTYVFGYLNQEKPAHDAV